MESTGSRGGLDRRYAWPSLCNHWQINNRTHSPKQWQMCSSRQSFTAPVCHLTTRTNSFPRPTLVLQGEAGANGIPGLDGREGHPVRHRVIVLILHAGRVHKRMLWLMSTFTTRPEVDKVPWWNVWWLASQFYNWCSHSFCQTWNPNTCLYVCYIYPHGEQCSEISRRLWNKKYYVDSK